MQSPDANGCTVEFWELIKQIIFVGKGDPVTNSPGRVMIASNTKHAKWQAFLLEPISIIRSDLKPRIGIYKCLYICV